MARATFVKAARKDYPDHGIKKGESYYWWAFMSGGCGGAKRYSKEKPKPSQLTQSEFWGEVYGIQEDAETEPDFDDIESQIEDLKSRLEDVRDTTQEKYDNLPDSLQNGSSGELLQGRVDALDEAISSLESVDVSIDLGDVKEDSDEAVDLKSARVAEVWGEVQSALSGISCE